jgi:hypothetical protein
LDRISSTLLLALLVLCLLALPASAATLEDNMTDPVGDVIASVTEESVDMPSVDIVNVRVDDRVGDLEVSITLGGDHDVNASYTANVMVDADGLFTFSYEGLGGFMGQDPIGVSVAVSGRFETTKVVWAVETSLLSVDSGLYIDSAYSYVENSTGAILEDSLDRGPLNDPPVVTVTFPSVSQTVSGTIDITGTASDDLAVMKVYIRIDTADWKVASGTDNWTQGLDTTTLDDGSHKLTVQAFDGNSGSPIITVRFTVDNSGSSNDPPMVHISWPADHTVDGTITIWGTAADDGGVTKVQVRIDGGGWLDAIGTGSWSYELDTSKLSDGKHTVEAIAFDEGDLTSPVVTGTFWVSPDPPQDNEAPVVTIYTPYNGTHIKRSWEDYTFRGIASDDQGVEYVEVRLDGASEWTKASVSGDDWSWDHDLRPLTIGPSHTFEARAFDGELMSRITKVIFVTYHTAPTCDVLVGEDTKKLITFNGESSSEADPIVKVEYSFDGGEWNEIPFQLNNSSPYDVVFTHTVNFVGMKGSDFTISFRTFDGHEYSLTDTFNIGIPGGEGPTPGPGPFIVLLSLVGMAMLLSRRLRSSSI